MICPNCSSARVRKAQRSLGEKIFLPLLLTRPYRCEDCIARFNGFLWHRTPGFSAEGADANSKVFRSATAALHSAVYSSRRARRYRATKEAKNLPAGAMAPENSGSLAHLSSPRAVAAWLKKPIVEPKALPPEGVAAMAPPPEKSADGFPEILAVILELKHEPETAKASAASGS
jgi:hypothetical protein